MRLLCLSNGHGEDTIALRILQALRDRPDCPTLEALPIVGEGHAYRKAGIPLVGSVKVMPSGGFIYQDSRQLARDLQGGLLQLTWDQIKTVRAWSQAKEASLVLAVGDIVPMLFGWISRSPFAFVGTAKSEYYLRDENGELPRPWWVDVWPRATGSLYEPWERWLMQRPNCRAVFPRDKITTQNLQRLGIPALDLGNPMMDGLVGEPLPFERATLSIALMPGSRPPECYANWELILQALDGIVGVQSESIELLSALVPSLDPSPLHQALVSHAWQPLDPMTYGKGAATLRLLPGQFEACIQRADLAISLAGTATEQFVGLGKPAIIIPGEGPQFTPAFAEGQTRLLGESVILIEQPSAVAAELRSLLHDPQRLQQIAENGKRRMGDPGAADRIADHLIQILRHS
jgi:uncharacterized protein (TIGR03492 family)